MTVETWDTPPYRLAIEEVTDRLGVDPERGLSEDEAEGRLDEHGPNRLRSAERTSAWRILFEQFTSVVIVILAVAAGLALALAHWVEGIAIVAVLLVNTGIGFFSEWRAVRTMESLQRTERRTTVVRREGRRQEVPADRLVPGDVVLLEAEDVVPADLRLVEGDTLRVEEAVLTGESVPVAKRPEAIDRDAPLAERHDMLHMGTAIAEGRAMGVVVATGMGTELGNISSLAEEASSRATPLQRKLDRLGRRLAWIVIGVAVAIALLGLALGRPTELMLETAIALGVAAIPEGLPIVATIALARGMWLMAQRDAVVNKLTAVETLGATRVIFSDKTGTLTENRMRAERVRTGGGDAPLTDCELDGTSLAHRLVELCVLCNNADLGDGGHGDPTEIALLEAGRTAGIERGRLLEDRPEVREESFDPDVMMMATFHREEDACLVAVKGAPDAVLDACTRLATGVSEERELTDDDREAWRQRNRDMAAGGLRVMAVADRYVDDEGADPYRELRLVGLIGLIDPPREGVRDAVERCQQAGLRVVMVTGDQADTARAVGEDIGLEVGDRTAVVHGRELDEPDHDTRERMRLATVFARVSPEQKLRLVELFQDDGEIVAMTGDGVNDAPALKQADIGVAMGRRGTDAARQVSDMVLRDDALSSIVAAVRQGRVIFGNIRRSVMFMLCTNVAEVVAVAVASVIGLPLPLRPLQILYLNVLTDVFPALALGLGQGDPAIMTRSPRPADEPVMRRSDWAAVGGWSALISTCVLIALELALSGLGLDRAAAVTVSFLTLAFAKLWFVFNLTEPGAPLVRNEVVRNPWIWGAIALCVGLLAAAVYFPPLAGILETRPPDTWAWVTVLGLSAVPFVIGQSIRTVQRIRADG